MQIGGILRFFQLIKDRAGIIRLHHQIENILSLIRLSKYSRNILFWDTIKIMYYPYLIYNFCPSILF
jgi:hypothetical protein